MIKAFLSHSSVDKDVVRKIKSKIQRIWTYFDEDCFEAGTDFRESIINHLADTNLFVLFVSSSSLESSWVNYEIDEAYWQTIQRNNIRILVLTLENIIVTQLPQWMRKAKFEPVTSIQLAAQIIKNILFESVSLDEQVYVGREKDINKFYDDMNNYEENFPNVITLTGHNGIGRRTFIKDILSKRFSIHYTSVFFLEESETLIELYKQFLDENIEGYTPEKISEHYEWFLTAKANDKVGEICRMLTLYNEKNFCPIIVDNGAMLNDAGYYKDVFIGIIRHFAAHNPDYYLILLHTRLPQLSYQDKRLVYLRRLYALDDTACYTLFDSLLKRNNVPISDNSQVREIASYLEGYPPAVINATRECKLEGVDIVCNDKSNLIDFQSRLFSKYYEKIPLNVAESDLLTVIKNLGNVAISILSVIVQKAPEDVARSLRVCHDYNLVELRPDGTYMISPPMRTAIEHKLPRFDKKKFSEISVVLIEKLWKPKDVLKFETIDVIINTVLRSGQEGSLEEFRNYILPSHLLKAAENANQILDWPMVEKYARRALDLDSQLNDARVWLFKALVRQETQKNISKSETEENELIDYLKQMYDIRHYYLEGFRFWKRHRFREAIQEFEYSIKAGDNSIPTHRDLAECYYQNGQIKEAQKEITEAIRPGTNNNPFILDLAAKIAISLGDLEQADELLGKQQLVDKYENVEHRRATYYVKAEDYDNALIHSTNACGGERVLPEMHLLRMNIAIHLRKYDIVEEEYSTIKKKYRHYSFDTLEVLYATMLLTTKGWKVAEASFGKINKKDSPFALNLKHKILTEKLKDVTISPLDRQKAEKEIAAIKSRRTLDILLQLQCYERLS